MRSSDINLNKTLRRNRLVFASFVDEYEPLLSIVTIAGPFILYPTFMWYYLPFKNANEDVIKYFLLPLCFLFGIYFIWKKLNERRFTTISKIEDTKNLRNILISTFQERDWQIDFQAQDYVIANTGMDLTSVGYQVTAIFHEDNVYLNVIKNSFRSLRMPSIINSSQLTNDILNAPEIKKALN